MICLRLYELHDSLVTCISACFLYCISQPFECTACTSLILLIIAHNYFCVASTTVTFIIFVLCVYCVVVVFVEFFVLLCYVLNICWICQCLKLLSKNMASEDIIFTVTNDIFVVIKYCCQVNKIC